MFTVNAFSHLVDGLRAIQSHRRSERILRDLPPHLRRDIGIDADQPRRTRG